LTLRLLNPRAAEEAKKEAIIEGIRREVYAHQAKPYSIKVRELNKLAHFLEAQAP